MAHVVEDEDEDELGWTAPPLDENPRTVTVEYDEPQQQPDPTKELRQENVSLREENQGLREFSEGLKEANDVLKREWEASQRQARDLRGDITNLEGHVDELRNAAMNEAKTGESYKKKCAELEQKLVEERASASDRKRKIKSYVESLDVEKARLEQEIAALKTRAETAEYQLMETQQKCDAAFQSAGDAQKKSDAVILEAQKKSDAIILEAKNKSDAVIHEERAKTEADKKALEEKYSSQIEQLEDDLKSAKKRADAMKEAVDELATHKSKRLAAKSEMVALARVLEAERERSSTNEKRLRDAAIPRAIEAGASLRDAIARVEDLQLSAARTSGRALRPPRPNSNFDDRIPSGDNPMHRGTSAASSSSHADDDVDDDDEEVKAGGAHRRNSKEDPVAEALNRLDKESDGLNSGFTLLTQTLDLLEDQIHAVRPCPPMLGDCWDMILGLTAPAKPNRQQQHQHQTTPSSSSYAKVALSHHDQLDHDDDAL